MTSANVATVFFFMCLMAVASGDATLSREKRAILDWDVFGMNMTTYSNISDDLSIYCGGVTVNINVSVAYLDSLMVANVAELRTVNGTGEFHDDPACIAPKLLGATTVELNFDDGFGQCSYSVESTDDYIVVEYTICVVPDNPLGISRDTAEFIHFTCKYERDLEVSLLDPLLPLIGQEKIFLEPLESDLDLYMARYTDATFNDLSDNEVALVGEQIFVGVWLPIGVDYDIILRGQTCWATPIPEAHGTMDPINYYFIISGCAYTDPDLPDANHIYENFHSNRMLFSFTGFYWNSVDVATQRLYIHCNVKACDNTIAANLCTEPIFPFCPATNLRKKRDVSPPRPGKDEKTITIGPIHLKKDPSNVCNKEALGCNYDCVTYNNGHTACVCPSGFVLDLDGTTCKLVLADSETGQSMDEVMEIYREENQMLFSYVVYIAAGLFLVFTCLAAVSCVLLRKQNVPFKI